ncbi:hypothetical protein C2S51_020276 [Perilla frutescens var. frutescens]|nr:hypothetical protein C2S51_020276 [Perilla frutescens var. frutescens]
MRQKYCGPSHPERVPLRKSDTRVWRRLVRVGMQAHEHIRWTLGAGEVSFWDDVWYDDLPLSVFCPATVFDHMSVDWYFDGESWSMPRLYALCVHFALPDGMIDSLNRTSVMWGERDSMRWNLTSTGEFSLTSAWDQVRVLVDVCLQSRRTHLASRCHCCDDPQVESLDHTSSWVLEGVVSTILSEAHQLLASLPCFLVSLDEEEQLKHHGVHFLVSHIVWQVPFMHVSDPVPRSLRSRMVSWRPLEALSVKLNTNVSFSTNLQMAAGGGGFVRDYTGALLAGFCVPLRAASSFNVEFQALLHGLRLTVQYSDHIWIKMDAASVVSVLESGQSGSAVTRHTLTSIRLLCRGRHVRFFHIHHEGNWAADYLAGRGFRPLRLPFMIHLLLLDICSP